MIKIYHSGGPKDGVTDEIESKYDFSITEVYITGDVLLVELKIFGDEGTEYTLHSWNLTSDPRLDAALNAIKESARKAMEQTMTSV